MAEAINEPTVIEDKSVNKAISDAVDTHKATEDSTAPGNKGEKKETTESAKDTIEKKDDLSDDERTQALDLFKALKNPESAPTVIAFLAEKAGYTKTELKKVDTPAAAAEIKDDVFEVFAEQFGEDFAKKILPAFNKIIDKRVADNTKEIVDRISTNELKDLEKESAKTLGELSKQYTDKDMFEDDVAAEMSKIMDRMPAQAGSTMKEYLEDIYLIAVGRLGKENKKAPVTKAAINEDKANKNRSDVGSRTSASGSSPIPGANSETRSNRTAQFPTLKDAIVGAMASVGKDN